MGNYMSKLSSNADESRKENDEPKAAVQQENTQDNEMCTPITIDRKMLVDPRSATAEIVRTPIEVDSTPVRTTKKAANAIPRYLQRKQYLETDMDVVMPPLTPKKHFVAESTDDIDLSEMDETRNHLTSNIALMDPNKMTLIEKERYRVLGLDPRSPAADFDRTPILLPRSLALLKARLQENAGRKGSYETDVYNSTNSYEEAGINIPEIHLAPDVSAEDPETLNSKIQNELHMSSTPLSDTDSSVFTSEEDITVIKNPKFNKNKLISKELSFHTNEGEDKQDDCTDVEKDMKVMHTKDDDRIKIWHDTSSSKEDVSGKTKEKDGIEEKLSRERIIRKKITFDECNTKSTLVPKVTKTEENVPMNEDIAERKKRILKTDGKSDEKKIFSPDNRHGSEVTKNRTPLSNRSNNGQSQGMPMKSPQQLLRDKAITVKPQQENTPPQRYTAKTRNDIRWDSNTTVFI